MEDIEVENKEEFIKQRNEYIKQHEKYAEVDILISQEDEPVFSSVSINGVGIEEVAKMIVALKTTKEQLENKYPVAKMMSKFMSVETEKMED